MTRCFCHLAVHPGNSLSVRVECLHFANLSWESGVCRDWQAAAFALIYQFSSYLGVASVYLRRSERLWEMKSAFFRKSSPAANSSSKHLLGTSCMPNMVLVTLGELSLPFISTCLSPSKSSSDASRLHEGFPD